MERKTIYRNAIRMLLCGLIFFAVTMPFRELFSLMPVTEVRPASALPPALGLLFGVWGALGTALGNLTADIISGYSPWLCVTGFAAQFLYGYIPFKLWYALGSQKEEQEFPKLDTARHVVKYLFIVAIDSLMVAGLLGFLMEGFGISQFLSSTTFVLLLNNFDFCILLGMPVIILVSVTGISVDVQKEKKHSQTGLLAAWAGILLLCAFALTEALRPGLLSVWPCAAAAFLFFFAAAIWSPSGQTLKERKGRHPLSMNEKIILIFLILGIIAGAIAGNAAYHGFFAQGAAAVDLWNRVYSYVAISLNLFFLISLLFLWYMETNITVPLASLSDVTRYYAEDRSQAINHDRVIETCTPLGKKKTEVGNLARSFVKMVSDLETYMENLTKVTAEKERIGAELDVATHIQASMLPCIFPPFPDRTEFDLSASMAPAKEVGGDFYDFFLVDEDHLAVVIADVSGKGVPAALFMVIAKTLIKDQTQTGKSAAEVFDEVNEQLCESNDEGLFVTAWLGILEISTGHMEFVNAGHNPPVICSRDGEFAYLKMRPGFVLAGMEGMHYRMGTFDFHPGDILYLYTDGVTEATNLREELYGEDRLKRILDENKQVAPAELIERVKMDVDAFAGQAPQFDDITMLALKILQQTSNRLKPGC